MDPRLQLITLGVPDVAAARRFYVDGLGWPPVFEVPDEITFVQVGPGLLIGLWSAAKLDADSGRPDAGTATPAPLSLAQIVQTQGEVDAVLAAAEAAGASILKPAQYAEFGGYHGYFADPAGFRWEVATNPGWTVADDGTVTLVPVEA